MSRRFPIISPERELEAAREYRRTGNIRLRNELCEGHMGFVYSCARKLRGYADVDDLAQQGMLGLLDAIERFDPDRGVRLVTYASHWIWVRMYRFAKKQQRVVSIGGLANRTMEEVRKVGATVPIDSPLWHDNDQTVGDTLEHDAPSPEDQAATSEVRDVIDAKLSRLSPRELWVVQERWLGPRGEKPLAELGERLGVSRERVRQIESQAFDRMRPAGGRERRA